MIIDSLKRQELDADGVNSIMIYPKEVVKEVAERALVKIWNKLAKAGVDHKIAEDIRILLTDSFNLEEK